MKSSSRISQLKAGAALSYATMGLGYLISLVYTPVMLRLLGQSEYGLYNLVVSVVSYLGLLNFGFGSSYMRYYSRLKVESDETNIAKLNALFLIIFSITGAVAVIAGLTLTLHSDALFGSELTSQETVLAKILMSILVVNIAVSFPNIIFNSYITANERFVFQKIVQMFRIVVNPFVILPVLLMGYGSVGMVAASTVLNILIETANIVYCFRKLNMRFSFYALDYSLMKEAAVFSSFIFINMVVDQVNWNADKYILGRFYGTIPVAVYGLAAQINMHYQSISVAISSVFVPRVHRMTAENQNMTQLFTRIGRVQFILLSLIASGFIFFGRPFIAAWAGREYAEAYWIVLILILSVTVPLIQNIGIEIQRAKDLHRFRSRIYCLIAAANILLTIPLARAYGGIGAAIGTAAALIIGNGFIMNIYYHIKIGLDMKYFWKQILNFLPSLILPVLFGSLVTLLIDLNDIPNLCLSGTGYILVFSMSVWFIGMNEYEKSLVRKPVLGLLDKIKLHI